MKHTLRQSNQEFETALWTLRNDLYEIDRRYGKLLNFVRKQSQISVEARELLRELGELK